MNKLVKQIKYLAALLLLLGIAIPWQEVAAQGSATTISGSATACVGDNKVYTPAISNVAYAYHWSVLPAGAGTVLSGNHTGATVQWLSPGAATVRLYILNPLLPTDTLYHASHAVMVTAMPAPFITTNVELGCQPLNEDPRQEGSPKFDDEHCQLVCEHSTVRYFANGTTGSTYTWLVTGALSYTASASGDYCDVNWGASGFGEVQLTEITVGGCETATSFCVEIIAGPHAKFVQVPDLEDVMIICRYGELVLQDASIASPSSPIVSYLWDWGDGHTTPMSPGAAGSPMSHVYETPGVYNVTLTVVNSCGCASRFTRKLKVEEREAPKIACPRVVCEGELATYSIPSEYRCSPDSWSVTGGTIVGMDAERIKVIWDNVDPNTGFGYVMYRTCEPCRMTVVEPVPVILERAEIQGPPVVCTGEQYIYRLPKWPAVEFTWAVTGPAILEPTDQRNEIALRVIGSGSISLSVEYTSTVLKGCSGSAQMNIQVLPPALINGPAAICQNAPAATFSLSGGHSGSWTLRTATGGFVAAGTGTGFPYTFTTPGNYRLSVQGTTFCPPEDHIIKVVPTPALPDLISGPERACTGIPTRYDVGNPLPGTTFKWFVVGGTANAAVGDHTYITFTTLPAIVKAVRVTTDGLSCASDTLYFQVLAPVPPLLISGKDSVCHSTIEPYSLNYTEGDHYEWEVVPATAGSVVAGGNTPNPQIQWNIPVAGGIVTLRAKVTKCGSTQSVTKSVFVRSTPVITSVNVLPGTTVCSGDTITLNVNTTYGITSGTYEVNWGDGPAVFYAIPSDIKHVYNTAGASANMAFTPVVILHDANGCLGSVSYTVATITVKPAPVAVLSPGGMHLHCGEPIVPAKTFTATVTTGIGGSEDYIWTTPTAASNPGNVPINNVANAYGSYYVTVQNSLSGCSSTSNVVTIVQNCGGGTSPGDSCGPAPTVVLAGDTAHCGNLSVSATVSGVPATGHIWSASPGVTIGDTTASSLEATADVAGLYSIKYDVLYGTGCKRTYNINVLVPYVPDMRSSISCNQPGGGYYVTLYDHSTEYPLTPIVDVDYFIATASSPVIGSGATITVPQPAGTTRTYIQRIRRPGFAPCYDTLVITTPAFPSVNVWLDGAVPNPGCVEDVVFNFHHSDAGSITSHLWSFGDGSENMSDTNLIGRVYEDLGPMLVSLRVTDLYGCYASASTSVNVMGNPYKGTITALPNPVCQGNPVQLNYVPALTYPTMPTSYTWYRESTALATTPGSSYNVFTPGGYWVQGTGIYGCKVESDNMVAVEVNQVPPVSISGNAGACIHQPFILSTQDYGGSYSYSWYRGGSPAGTGTSLTQTLGSTGTHTYFVVITDIATGCKDTSATFTVTVSLPPAPPSLSFNITSCDPYEVELSASGVPGVYNWSNGMSGTPIYTPFGGDYQVTLTDTNGCVVQNSISVPKSLEEYMWVFPTGCFCAQQSAYLIGPLIPLNWAWLRDGIPVSSGGWGLMPPYGPSPGHIYNMYLDNGWCQLTSGDMHYMSDTCERLPRAAGRMGEETMDYGMKLAATAHNLLEVSPNPAGNSHATAHFVLAAGSRQRSIELVDITGRVLQTHVLEQDKGSLRIELAGYASGMYNVVLRRNGIVVQTVKLSKTE